MRARIFTAIGVLATLSVISVPAQQIKPVPAPQTRAADVLPGSNAAAAATMQGLALSSGNKPLAARIVQLREAEVGRVVRSLVTDEKGEFVFDAIEPGSYVVELLTNRRTVAATSALFQVRAGQAATAIVREPMPQKPADSIIGFAAAHAEIVRSAAATSGILGSQVTGDDVSPR